MATDAIVAIQDMGAAGLTSSSVEMSSKGGVGIALTLDQVPMRETGMTPYEIMLSESQERMLMILKPGLEDVARRIFEKWELDFAIIGRVTDTGRLVVSMGGKVAADIPVAPLVEAAPVYDRPHVATPKRPRLQPKDVPAPADLGAALEMLMASPDMACKRWIWEQYDHLVRGETVQRPGGDAAVVRLPHSKRALAMTTDCTPRYCVADPVEGGRQAVAESWRNLTAVGAKPLALTDNMNFGNPERPEIMGQFAGCIEGMAEACQALAYPVVSGNVSLYNETNGQGILPTPVIGGVGLIDDVARHMSLGLKRAGTTLVLIGATQGWLGASLYLREILLREDGAPPPVDLAAERRNGDLVRALIDERAILACHDLSDGGLLVAAAEMALAGFLGARLDRGPAGLPDHAWLFGEDQGRYLLEVADPVAVLARAEAAQVPARAVGTTGGDALIFAGNRLISLKDLRAAHEAWLPKYMGAA
jgi:phosphoribosylformylglycinamidine synthase